MKIITSWHTLMQYATAVGKAKKTGDIEALKQAEERLKEYEDLVKRSDETLTGFTHGDLY
jgi:hypothetical protein